MNPYYSENGITIYHGDAREILSTLDPVDAVVTDPPYGLQFMGKRWDYDVPSGDLWQACLDVLKPGAHLLAFAGTRTQHRMAVNIEDAGFEIRDMIAWVYGSGFPKSHDVSKAIDKAAGAEREVVGSRKKRGAFGGVAYAQDKWTLGQANQPLELNISQPATEAARRWEGFGTALKPALEPITLARKPIEGTIAANVLEHGTGALNVDGCRVGTEHRVNTGASPQRVNTMGRPDHSGSGWNEGHKPTEVTGRWPANLIHDASPEVLALFPEASNGSAARFFYSPKASRSERGNDNKHPTVKPISLMRYLCRLITPPRGLVLDPFAGSGSTLLAAQREGFRVIGIEISERYCEIAANRLASSDYSPQGEILL